MPKRRECRCVDNAPWRSGDPCEFDEGQVYECIASDGYVSVGFDEDVTCVSIPTDDFHDRFEPLYPQHYRLEDLEGENDAVGAFIQWLDSEGYIIAQCNEDDRLVPAMRTVQQWLADYYDIDLKELDKEKRQMVERMREIAEPNSTDE